jgi:hypothetical protein
MTDFKWKCGNQVSSNTVTVEITTVVCTNLFTYLLKSIVTYCIKNALKLAYVHLQFLTSSLGLRFRTPLQNGRERKKRRDGRVRGENVKRTAGIFVYFGLCPAVLSFRRHYVANNLRKELKYDINTKKQNANRRYRFIQPSIINININS